MELEHEPQVLVTEVGQLFLREVGYIDVVDENGSSVRAIEGTDNLQKGGFTSTGRTYDAHHFALIDMEVDAFQHLQRSEALRNILNINHNSLFVICNASRMNPTQDSIIDTLLFMVLSLSETHSFILGISILIGEDNHQVLT